MVATWNAQTQEAEEQEPCECENGEITNNMTFIKQKFNYEVYQCELCGANRRFTMARYDKQNKEKGGIACNQIVIDKIKSGIAKMKPCHGVCRRRKKTIRNLAQRI